MANTAHAHSNRVALLRKALLGAALLAVLALVVLSNPNRLGGRVSETLLTGGPRITKPQYDGALGDGRAYRLTGDSAQQIDEGATVLIQAPLITIAAAGDRPAMQMTAKTLRRFAARNIAEMRGDVRVTADDGTRFDSQIMHLHLADNRLTIPQALTGTAPSGDIRAARMRGDIDAQDYHFETVDMVLTRSRP